jgi:4-hydroxyproline epimerase
MVGALLCEPQDKSCVAGVLFFNNVGQLWMCGHGTIGVAVTLGYMGKIGPGRHKIETAVGTVSFTLDNANTATIENVHSYRYKKDVAVEVEGVGEIVGDIAWGGNWFFLVKDHGQQVDLKNVERLTDLTWRIRQALEKNHITGEKGGEIDHIELFGPPADERNDSRNFMLCPGKAYDRSPCGTGTSAKMACLVADGKLKPGEIWRQEGIVGTVFEGFVRMDGDKIIPSIRGSGYVNSEATLLLDSADPFRMGIRS